MQSVYYFLLACFLMATAVSLVVLPNVLLISHKKRLFDNPNERKVHKLPVPRLGGISFFPVILITLGAAVVVFNMLGLKSNSFSAEVFSQFMALFTGSMMLFLVGLTDDLIGVGYKKKFLVQVISALLFVASGVWIKSLDGLFGVYELPTWVGMTLTVALLVYITNAINLIDGIDGLASGLCALAVASLAVLYIILQQNIYAMLALATLGVLLPFWVINVFGNARRGRKLFMGDSGSLTLGYILSFLIIKMSDVDVCGGSRTGCCLVLGLSTLLVPLFDVVRVVVHRVRCGRNPFLPDKNHIHHKLMLVGLRARYVMGIIILLALLLVVTNACLVSRLNVTWILCIDTLIWMAFHAVLDILIWKQQKEDK